MYFLPLASCTLIQLQLHDDDLQLLNHDPIVYVVTFKPPPFEVDTSTNVAVIGGALGGAAGGAIGGVIGAVATGAATNAIDEANISADIQRDPRALVTSIQYEDPVKQVREEFLRLVREESKLSKFVIVDEVLDSPNALGGRFHDGIVLGFKTE